MTRVLPSYRIDDQVIFVSKPTMLSVGTIRGIESSGEDWKYLLAYSENTTTKLNTFMQSAIRGLLFNGYQKLENSGGVGSTDEIDDIINLDL